MSEVSHRAGAPRCPFRRSGPRSLQQSPHQHRPAEGISRENVTEEWSWSTLWDASGWRENCMSPKKSQESGLVPAIARPHDGRNKGDYGKVPRKKSNIENLDVVTPVNYCGQSLARAHETKHYYITLIQSENTVRSSSMAIDRIRCR